MSVPCQWPEGNCAIALVGEAPGGDEVALGKPFVGSSGRLLNMVLAKAGIRRNECLITNAFDFKLKGNSVKSICVKKEEADSEFAIPVENGAYVPKEIAFPQLERLEDELQMANPTVVVALGGTAAWALLNVCPYGKMAKMRGTVNKGLLEKKVLVTYHPAYIARNRKFLPLVVNDLRKAKVESLTEELVKDEVEMIIPTKAEEVIEFIRELGSPAAVDIETLRGYMIDNIGFSDRIGRAMSVPILDPNTYEPYWENTTELTLKPTPQGAKPRISECPEEALVMSCICDYLEDRTRKKVMQNGSYDTQWIYEKWGVTVRGWSEDTRLMHHALFPELPKDLGTMASIYLNLPSWKLAGAGRKTTKKED